MKRIAIFFLISITWNHYAIAANTEATPEEWEIIELACKVEKYIGEEEHTTCLQKQLSLIETSTFREDAYTLPLNIFNTAKQACEDERRLGIDLYYACIYQAAEKHHPSTHTQKEILRDLPFDDEDTANQESFEWPEWHPLPLTMPATRGITPKTASEVFYQASKSIYTVVAAPTAEHLIAEEDVVLGSAVAISNNMLLTNCHVVEDNSAIVILREDEAEVAYLKSAKKEYDSCILETDITSLVPAYKIRGYTYLETGERVYAIGSPNGLENTMSEGIISGLRGTDEISIIQTSAAISRGSSGGGLFDSYGNLIGITTFMIKDGQALNFAIAIDEFFRE